MAIDTKEKRANVLGVGRPWMRDKFPVATPDEQWRASSANSYGGNALTPSATVGRLLLINPPGLDGGFGTGLSL